ncbi:hypothetical protein [Microbulbifer rhizosphaerae]|uniref:Diaminopimelate epimerase n=1 Tax=Microbulbifer rhizosphaerae TaxID=1562603 RepID=A0A7W4WBM7_9GAMM|nr:hypothetical protein [Microbulbifer rhizosphaerae]MBB3060713.1 diaminopimelate epimerase [Microbulbifer rhizosphaerae]
MIDPLVTQMEFGIYFLVYSVASRLRGTYNTAHFVRKYFGEFSVETKDGDVRATIHELGHLFSIEMGEVRFSHGIEKFQSPRAETINIPGKFFEFYRDSVGNPQCVILVDELAPALAIEYGPVIENNEKF